MLRLGIAQLLFLRHAAPCRGRDHASISPKRAAIRVAQGPGQRRAAASGGRGGRRSRPSRTRRVLEHAGLAVARLVRRPMARTSARAIAHGASQGGAARPHRQARSGSWARGARGRDAADRARCGAAPAARSRICPATARARGGCRTRRRRCRRRSARRRRGQDASSISAPRPAARPRSWRRWARGSSPSTARRGGSSALNANLARLALDGRHAWSPTRRMWRPAAPARFVLLDAPCTATGAIRRHPDVPHLKSPDDVDAAGRACRSGSWPPRCRMLAPGGMLVYCTCSLEPQEGPAAGRAPAGARRAGDAPRRSAAVEIGGLARMRHRRRRSAHAALPSRRARTGSTAFTPRDSSDTA